MIFIVSIFLLLSLTLNVILVWYCRKVLTKMYFASEAASEIFSRLDAYKQHIKTIYANDMFYGDRDLRDVISHTTELLDFLKKYDIVYSFTQPELEEILKEEDIIPDGEEEQKEVQKIFWSRT